MTNTIHVRQLVFLQFLGQISTGIVFPTTLIIKTAGPGLWISLLIGNVGGILAGMVVLLLDKKFPDKDPIEISELIFGKIGRIIFGLFFTFFFFETSIVILREYAEFIKASLLNRTPIVAIIFSTLLVSGYAVHSGLEVIGRMGDFIIAVVVFSLFFLLFFIAKETEFSYLFPIFDKGWSGILRGGLLPFVWTSQVFIGSMFLPYLKQKNKKKMSIFFPLFWASGTEIVTLMITIGVLGVEMAGRLKFPLFIASSMGRVPLFEQTDILLIAVWIFGISMKLFSFHLAAVMSLQRTFKVQSYKPFVLPISLLIGIYAFTFFKSDIDLIHFLQTSLLNLIFFTIFLPSLLFISSFMRKAKG